ncbi:MAG: dehydrogenase (ubiquinone) [Acidimicrobiaceae bacterium]|nr:dehydrogenase (ubiquinone) [Acidimicrobiaceae bacterium]
MVVGAGFGGLNTVRGLVGSGAEVTIVDRDNYHGFWPLLYQVATAGLSPEDIAYPIRAIFSGNPQVTVRHAVVTGLDLEARKVRLDRGEDLAYEYLVLATGSSTADFGIAGVAEHAFPLKTLRDALRLRNHVLRAFEEADGEPPGSDGLLTVLLVGGGPTGVELAGALAELIGTNLAADFPHLDVSRARVLLLEATDHVLGGFSTKSQQEALRALSARGVEVRLGAKLAEVTPDGVRLSDGSEIPARTVVWTAGVRANPLGELVPGAKAPNGAVPVSSDLSLPEHPEVFVIGDLAAVTDKRGRPLPQLAQVAIQGGKHTARTIRHRLAGEPSTAFRYHNHGIMATIGRGSAVAELPGGFKLQGTVGWLSWLVVHLVFLIGFRNRVLVLVNWAWNYVTFDRASRVILDDVGPAPADPLTPRPSGPSLGQAL